MIFFGCIILHRKCCLWRAVPCHYHNPNPHEVWSKNIFRGLSFYGINLRIIQTQIKMVVVLVDEVSFNEVSHTNCFFISL